MSFLNMLLGDNDKLTEKDIAQDMIKDSKFGVTSLTGAVAEATNPELREMLKSQLDKAVSEHFELSDILINKNWYPAYDGPAEQLKKDYEKAKDLL
ncbi:MULTISPECIES: spore coat protein [Clostridium]|uniref:Spore coat protein n=1 Tax=Clostridium cibarium TaxID=2762247 RepID=A0ABR8PQQ6_9CLOT|nr:MULTISPECIES: spore coat protein [Clostridium]MBD7910498.1 spore coat protein [Clostridium cibarium]